MTPSDNADLENLLRQYRPLGPPPSLRQKILATPAPVSPIPLPSHNWPILLFRSAIAALLLLSFTLLHAANSLNLATASHIGAGPVQWSPDAEAAATLLDSGASGRQYVALCLLAGSKYPPSFQTSANPAN